MYHKTRQLTEVFRTTANSCKNKYGELATDFQSTLKLWREYFTNRLNASSYETTGDDNDANPAINDNEIDVPFPDIDGIRIVKARLEISRGTKAGSLSASLFKYIGVKLLSSIHQLIWRI